MIRVAPKILDVSRSLSIEPRIAYFRYFLAVFVVFVHLIPWYEHSKLHVEVYLAQFALLISKGFQPYGETNPAVLAFITLSGYCIHRNGIRNDHNVPLWSFLIRRCFRILPLFLIGTLLGVVVFSYIGDQQVIKDCTGTSNLSMVGFVLKVMGLHSFFPFFFNQVYQGNGPLITAAVEFWLYLIYPVALLCIKKYGDRNFIKALLLTTFLGSAFSWFFGLTSWWHNGSLFGFITYWYIGCYALDKRILNFGLLTVSGYILLSVVSIFLSDSFLLVELRKILFCLMLGIFIRFFDRDNSKSMSSGNAFWESGYSLYAIHTPLIMVCMCYNVPYTLSFLVIVLTSYFVYKIIELPMLRMGRVISHKISKLDSKVHIANYVEKIL